MKEKECRRASTPSQAYIKIITKSTKTKDDLIIYRYLNIVPNDVYLY
jgi:hypothetical protein